MTQNGEKSTADQEWEARTLCADEGCIGVVGPDGHCKECGLAYPGWEDRGGGAAQENDPDEVAEDGVASEPASADEESEADFSVDNSEEDAAADEADSDWDSRVLCRDESCIGVIGPDGRCRECGLPYEESRS